MVWQSAQTRCFTYVTDAIEGTPAGRDQRRGHRQRLQHRKTQETTVGEAVDLIAKLTGFDLPAIPVSTGEKLGPAHQDLARRIPDTARANPWWLAMPDSGAA